MRCFGTEQQFGRVGGIRGVNGHILGNYGFDRAVLVWPRLSRCMSCPDMTPGTVDCMWHSRVPTRRYRNRRMKIASRVPKHGSVSLVGSV